MRVDALQPAPSKLPKHRSIRYLTAFSDEEDDGPEDEQRVHPVEAELRLYKGCSWST